MDEKPKRKVGRPSKEIDWKMVESLAQIQCTAMEIAAVMNIPHSTLTGRAEFSEVYEKGKENGKASLRRTQFKLAQKNAALAIWLGKQLLGQREPDKLADIESAQNTKAILEELVKGMRNNV
jgi:hypothetical protein